MSASTRVLLSPVAIVLANLASLAVVWWHGRNVHGLLVVYWLEAGIVSAVYVAKILRAEGTDDPETVRSWASADGKPADRLVGKPNRTVADAVVTNFAGPWVSFGLLIVLAGAVDRFGEFEPASPGAVALATFGLLTYHLLSYRFEYVGFGEYERRGPVSLFVELAPRHLAVALTWIFGMGAAAATRNPVGALVVLVCLKTCVDLVAHRRERSLASA